MILFVTNAYKENREDYANGFVHTRALAYKDKGYDVQVFKPSSKYKRYTIEGIQVTAGSGENLREIIEQSQVDTVCVHFIGPYAINPFNQIDRKLNVFVFVHGNEVLHWYERIFTGTIVSLHSFLAFLKYSLHNVRNMRVIRNFLHSTHHSIRLIAVSKWMANIGIKNWRTTSKWEIIPNYINEELYPFEKKSAGLRYNFLSIRPYTSGKYANDITVQFIIEMRKHPAFNSMKFTVIGQGPLWEKTVAPLRQFENVKLINKFLNSDEIREYHAQNGFMICPTRQDAQGVSMCEAMSSGLVPLTLNNTAIPEFLPEIPGILCDNVHEMYEFAARLIENEKLFLDISEKCSLVIKSKCGSSATIDKEISMVTSRNMRL